MQRDQSQPAGQFLFPCFRRDSAPPTPQLASRFCSLLGSVIQDRRPRAPPQPNALGPGAARRVTPESPPLASLPGRFRRGALWVVGRGLLATTMAGDVASRSCTDADLLLHPELLSQEFLLLTLEQKNITVDSDVKVNKDNLTDLYVQHAIPLPQRDLPKNRWGKMMEKKREQREIKNETKRSSTVDGLRKRPLIVFDGNSTSTSIKVKKTENGDNDRLKPPPQASVTNNAFRKLSNSSSSVSPLILSSNLPMNNKMEHNNNDTKQNHDLTHRKSPLGPVKSPPLSPVGTTPVKLKRAAPKEEAESAANNLKPPETKRKIQHVTWP